MPVVIALSLSCACVQGSIERGRGKGGQQARVPRARRAARETRSAVHGDRAGQHRRVPAGADHRARRGRGRQGGVRRGAGRQAGRRARRRSRASATTSPSTRRRRRSRSAAPRRRPREAELARRQAAVEDAPRPRRRRGDRAVRRPRVATAKADVDAAQQSAPRRAAQPARLVRARADRGRHPDAHRAGRASTSQPGAVLATLLQRDPMLLRFQVTEQDAPRLKPGMTANVTLRESARTYTAKITLVADAADPTTRLVAGHRRRSTRPSTSTGCAPARSARSTCPSATRAQAHRRAVARRAADRQGQRRLHRRRQEHRARRRASSSGCTRPRAASR